MVSTSSRRKQPAVHPHMSSVVIVKLSNDQLLDRSILFSTLQNNVQVHMWACVAPSTRDQYQCGWNHFLKYSVLFGTNATMTIQPSEFICMNIQSSPWPYTFQETVVLGFMAYLRDQIELEPSTVASYISGVRFMWKNMFIDSTFIDKSESIKATRAGMTLAFRMSDGAAKADRITLPMTTDMITKAISTVYNNTSYIASAIRTCLVLAFCCLMRISEYIVTPSKNHHLLAENVCFGFKDPSTNIVSFVYSYDHHILVTNMHNVVECLVTVRSAKNDSEGEGHRMNFKRNLNPSNTHGFDLTVSLLQWSIMVQPSRGSPFLSWKDSATISVLSSSNVNKSIKLIASEMGLDASRFSSHSLRIGGASALANAGIPDYVIQRMGRWKSLAFLGYIRLSVKAFTDAVNAMSDITNFTCEDLIRMNPGVITK